MIQLREQYWALQVPVDAWTLKCENFRTDFVINMGYLTYPTVGKKNWLELDGAPGLKPPGLDYNERAKGIIKLPPGKWEIVCTSKEVTEKQAAAIVERNNFGYFIYMNNYTCIATYYQTPKPSFRSLLTSKGCDLNKNWLILKKIQ